MLAPLFEGLILWGTCISSRSRIRDLTEMDENITWQLKLKRTQKGKSQTGAGII
jgi:hypothetical protein